MQVSLLTESGGTKDDLKLPTDETLLTQVRALNHIWLSAGASWQTVFLVTYSLALLSTD